MTFSILCISRVDECALPFINHLQEVAYELDKQFILAVDGHEAYRRALTFTINNPVLVHSKGYFESALDQALVACTSDYILRLDDDERISPKMKDWLQSESWKTFDHWEFPRIHLWGDGILMTPHLFPDFQTRLSIKSKSGNRHGVHAPSPWGGGERAPVYIEHHKFLVKDYKERRRIAESYDTYSPGYGTGNMIPFSLPEEAYKGQRIRIVAQGDGQAEWKPLWEREEQW